MKYIANEFDYRTWFVSDYLGVDEDISSSLFAPEEIETAIRAEMPERFPCVVTLTTDKDFFGSVLIHYYYKQDIAQIGRFFGLTDNAFCENQC
ncbi:hypothetical protein [Serratia marcescens]|uniref:hypothetical protein n=1 Tax=Serratia marcescens TaxID=615 RepID=UPI000E2C6292|nr:hypothetical protein [Serratia marcescens]